MKRLSLQRDNRFFYAYLHLPLKCYFLLEMFPYICSRHENFHEAKIGESRFI